jgi:hypothetical protein
VVHAQVHYEQTFRERAQGGGGSNVQMHYEQKAIDCGVWGGGGSGVKAYL